MEYPVEFVQKVKECFPEWETLHRSLDSGDVFAGQYLNSHTNLSPQMVLKYLDDNDLKRLRKLAKRHILISKLYIEWKRIYEARLCH